MDALKRQFTMKILKTHLDTLTTLRQALSLSKDKEEKERLTTKFAMSAGWFALCDIPVGFVPNVGYRFLDPSVFRRVIPIEHEMWLDELNAIQEKLAAYTSVMKDPQQIDTLMLRSYQLVAWLRAEKYTVTSVQRGNVHFYELKGISE